MTPGLRISTDGGGTWHPLTGDLDPARRTLRTAEAVPAGATIREMDAAPHRVWRVTASGYVAGHLAVLSPISPIPKG